MTEDMYKAYNDGYNDGYFEAIAKQLPKDLEDIFRKKFTIKRTHAKRTRAEIDKFLGIK